jgi:hypothetical protein
MRLPASVAIMRAPSADSRVPFGAKRTIPPEQRARLLQRVAAAADAAGWRSDQHTRRRQVEAAPQAVKQEE